MNDMLLLVWACIAIIGVIAIIIVKSYYGDKEVEDVDLSKITSKNPLQGVVSGKRKTGKDLNNYNSYDDIGYNDAGSNNNYASYDEPLRYEEPVRYNEPARYEEPVQYEEPVRYEEPIMYEEPQYESEPVQYESPKDSSLVNNRNISYSSQNQVLVNYEDNVKKFQEPITDTQREIMNRRNNVEPDRVTFRQASESKHELKDLFTIDELIKESKRKDDERERESKIINKEVPDNEDIKESIRKRRDSLEINNDNELKENTESDENNLQSTPSFSKSISNEDSHSQPISSQTDIEETVQPAPRMEQVQDQPNPITDPVFDDDVSNDDKTETDNTIQDTLTPDNKVDEFESLPLKTPKIKEEKTDTLFENSNSQLNAPRNSTGLFKDENGELSDLDYRKDLAKFTNSIKNSSIVKDIREKLNTEDDNEGINDEFIRNVNTYEEEVYEPIINETHVDYVASEEEPEPESDPIVFKMEEPADLKIEEEPATPEVVPERSNIKIMVNNNEEVLRKGDEIIYTYGGDTYSSKVYAISGNSIRVRYRGKDILIDENDVKKVY